MAMYVYLIFTLWRCMNILSLLCGDVLTFYLYLVAMQKLLIFHRKLFTFPEQNLFVRNYKVDTSALLPICQISSHLLVILNCVILEIFKVWYHERECKGISVRLAGLLALGRKWQKAAWLITFNLTSFNLKL